MASNIDIRHMDGVGPEYPLIESHLLRGDGSLRSQPEVAAEIGDQQAVLALLEYHLRQRINTPSTRGYPPRIFLSYRRESPAHIAWCQELALGLQSAGYRVYLDSLHSWSNDFDPQLVADFVAKLAHSDIVVPVITESYLGSEDDGRSFMHAWIWEEWLRIATLRDWGLLEIVAVWRSGDLDPARLVNISGALDWTIDVRDRGREGDTSDIRLVLDYFGSRDDDPALDENQQEELARAVAEIVRSGAERGADWCSNALGSISGFRFTEEYWLGAAWAARAAGDRTALLLAAIAIFRQNASLPTTFSVAKALWLGDLDAHAIGLLAEVAETPSLWRHQAHFILGDIFRSLGVWASAANHYRWCVTTNQNAKLGGWWSALGTEAIALAQERLSELEAALRLDAREIERHCDFCGADFHAGKGICLLCAASYSDRRDRCSFCGAGVVQVESLIVCALCHKGAVDSEKPGANFYLVPREPFGRFSVLARDVAPFPPMLEEPGTPLLGSWQQFVDLSSQHS